MARSRGENTSTFRGAVPRIDSSMRAVEWGDPAFSMRSEWEVLICH